MMQTDYRFNEEIYNFLTENCKTNFSNIRFRDGTWTIKLILYEGRSFSNYKIAHNVTDEEKQYDNYDFCVTYVRQMYNCTLYTHANIVLRNNKYRNNQSFPS